MSVGFKWQTSSYLPSLPPFLRSLLLVSPYHSVAEHRESLRARGGCGRLCLAIRHLGKKKEGGRVVGRGEGECLHSFINKHTILFLFRFSASRPSNTGAPFYTKRSCLFIRSFMRSHPASSSHLSFVRPEPTSVFLPLISLPSLSSPFPHPPSASWRRPSLSLPGRKPPW